ncbi:enolase C-terminal domain-like protein [Robbsia andropogonis]|uniref:enolase C-terminal domain-like protein n=1 Tax=Robbsia andropogonis TaxID=28092 RepID=UPI0004B6D9FB|nr:enolase C-terminal domain-like protein [Robbsia andropogonis]
MMLQIASIKVTPIAFKDPPLLNAAGIHEPFALRSIIEIETRGGAIGLGETYGDLPFVQMLEQMAARLHGHAVTDLNGLRALAQKVADAALQGYPDPKRPPPGSDPARAVAKLYGAFEVAFLDAHARHLGIPLCELLGGAVRREVPYSAYLFFKYAQHADCPYEPDSWGAALEPAQVVAQARRMIDQYGFRSIKLKAGALPVEREAETLRALHAAFPGYPLRIDPNGNWSLATAHRLGAELGNILEYFEDPAPTLEDMSTLHRDTGLLLATNMVVCDFNAFRRNLTLNGVQVILSDHHYWGGLRDTQLLARMCELHGIGLSMHSNSHMGISLMAMTHLGAAIPQINYDCDTHYPWQEEEIIAGGKIPIVDGKVSVTNSPGLGVTIDQDALAQLHAQYMRCGITHRDDGAEMTKYQPDYLQRSRPHF